MKAAKVGDRVVLEAVHAGNHRRVGIITELRREDGRPPYLVRWLEDGREALIFPGRDSRIEPGTGTGTGTGTVAVADLAAGPGAGAS